MLLPGPNSTGPAHGASTSMKRFQLPSKTFCVSFQPPEPLSAGGCAAPCQLLGVRATGTCRQQMLGGGCQRAPW